MSSEEAKKIILDLINEEKWTEIISRFVDVLRINIFTADALGHIILPPQKDKYGGVFLTDPSLGLKLNFDGQTFAQQFHSQGLYGEAVANYDLRCFAVPIYLEKDQTVGYVVVGPVILNKKLEEDEYKKLAQKQGAESQRVLNELHEIRVVSYVVLDSILDLLAAIVRDTVELRLEKKKIEQIRLKKDQLPKEFSQVAEEIYSTVRLDELLVTLLDVALKITNTECGSIMVLDDHKKELVLKVSRGLDEDKAKNAKVKIGEGIAGLAAKENSSFFISGDKTDSRIKHLLRRPEIKESLIMPLVAKSRVFGVLNLATKTGQARIGEHLESLQYISKIVSAAL